MKKLVKLLPFIAILSLAGCAGVFAPSNPEPTPEPVDPPYVPTYTVDKQTFEYYAHGDFQVAEEANFKITYVTRYDEGEEFTINEMAVEYDHNYVKRSENRYLGVNLGFKEDYYKDSTLSYFHEIKSRNASSITGDYYELFGVRWNKTENTELDTKIIKYKDISFEDARYNEVTHTYVAEHNYGGNTTFVYLLKFLDGKLIAFNNYLKNGIVPEGMYEVSSYGEVSLTPPQSEYCFSNEIMNSVDLYMRDTLSHFYQENTYSTAIQTFYKDEGDVNITYNYQDDEWVTTDDTSGLTPFYQLDTCFNENFGQFIAKYPNLTDFRLNVRDDNRSVGVIFKETSLTGQFVSDAAFSMLINEYGQVIELSHTDNSFTIMDFTVELH